jgi:hypothetical protein
MGPPILLQWTDQVRPNCPTKAAFKGLPTTSCGTRSKFGFARTSRPIRCVASDWATDRRS